ncbi:hypothetical protein [Pseudomonas putida]|uniref:Uncharacterized protein n=1 Tax=Pseudomonas putida TaxID=303 RepID=A0A6I6Y4Q8_PSEPU|nr:hypothetical protein [Pseudomonas putida]QHG66645.1 hypothetical protein C2H86_20510 [Pseudomonas putida]
MTKTLEITGTLSAPFIPQLSEGWPRLTLRVSSTAGQTLGTFSAQTTVSPMPFRLYLDSQNLEDAEVTLEALCTAGVGAEAVLARTTRTTSIADAISGPLDLSLEALDRGTPDVKIRSVSPSIIELNGEVIIPPELRQEAAILDVTLLVIQEDGYSNRYSSNLAEHSLLLNGDGAPFTLFIDPATVPDGRQVKLNIGLYDLERKTIFAGNSVKDVDLSAPPDLSMLILRKPRR